MSIAIGTQLGPYEVIQPIGAGGMGQVYKARDTRLNRTVAIKCFRRSSPPVPIGSNASSARRRPLLR